MCICLLSKHLRKRLAPESAEGKQAYFMSAFFLLKSTALSDFRQGRWPCDVTRTANSLSNENRFIA